MDCDIHDKYFPRKWTLPELKSIVDKWQTYMIANGGWNATYMENHDQGRGVSRYASDDPKYRTLSGKMLATYHVFQSGTIFVYQGQELAMANLPQEWGLDKYRDIECLNHWKKLIAEHPDDKKLQETTLEQYRLVGRDNARTPMQWDQSLNAGFTGAERPWMDVHPDFKDWNAEDQVHDPQSCYSYYASALALRKKEKDIFVYGDFELLDLPNESIFAYSRTYDEAKRALVICNFKETECAWQLPQGWEKGKIALQSYHDEPRIEGGSVKLRPFESFVLLVG